MGLPGQTVALDVFLPGMLNIFIDLCLHIRGTGFLFFSE